jgi:hypothetical protein
MQLLQQGTQLTKIQIQQTLSPLPGHSMQWRPLLPKGGGLIQVDIGGHPPVPNSNWLILTVFSSTCFSVMGTLLCNYGFCTSEVVLKPYTTSRWILVAAHLVQLAYFGQFSSQYIFLYFWGCFEALNNIFWACHSQTIDKSKFDGIMCSSRKYLSNGLSHA